jgi:acyl-homoserine-lactone acylase
MQSLYLVGLLFLFGCSSNQTNTADAKKWEAQAARITIIRDSWGIPHIYGKTDADAVFGLMYAQCEENFEKVERAYIEKLGRIAEVDGENYLYNDLLSRLLTDTTDAISAYNQSPAWLKNLCHAFADGVNYYIYKKPGKPLLLKKFEPWFAFLLTDGAYVSMKTENLSGEEIRRMYQWPAVTSFLFNEAEEMKGSNAFAIAPSKTADKKALLYINPHVSFDFRMEAHIVSEEGLNAYGAVTWGQFFIYQGFNETCGWMHTSSMADAVDLYEDDLVKIGDSLYTKYDGEAKPVKQKLLRIGIGRSNEIPEKEMLVFYTHHGPVVGKTENGKLLSLKTLNAPLKSLVQSWERTKAKNFEDFKNTLKLYANATTNTMYADAQGNIAYWHGNFIPKREAQYNWNMPLDGSTSKTAWQGAHSLNEIVHIENPQQGFLQNCNSSPFNVSGINSINQKNYPAYMAPDDENFRGLFAIKQLEKENSFTLDKMISVGYSHYLSAFDTLLPPLFAAFDKLGITDNLYLRLNEPVSVLKNWNRQSSTTSIATTLGVEWASYLLNETPVTNSFISSQLELIAIASKSSSQILLSSFDKAVAALQKNYGTWKVPWGDINRYQKIAAGENFDDDKQSLPVGMASAFFGSLPSYETVWNKTSKGYGTAGNSFVAAVEFGKKIKAKAVVPGGQSFNPSSKHFNDQAELYINGKLRDVFFYKEDVEKNKERTYKPGN